MTTNSNHKAVFGRFGISTGAFGAAVTLLALTLGAGAGGCGGKQDGAGSETPSEPSAPDPMSPTPTPPARPTPVPTMPPPTTTPPVTEPKPVEMPPPVVQPMPTEPETPPPATTPGTPGTGTGVAVAGPDGIIDLSTSECFNKPAEKIRVVVPGYSEHPFMSKGDIGMTFDMRGTKYTANQPRFPVLLNHPTDTCIVGPTSVGKQPRTLSWNEMKSVTNPNVRDGDAVGWEDSHGKIIVEGAWIDNVTDGIGPPFDYVPDRGTNFSIRHTYMRHITDDALENDGCLNGDMIDSFVDGAFTFMSSRQTKGVPRSGSTTVNLKDSILRLSCFLAPAFQQHTCQANYSVGKLFKTGCNTTVNMENVVIMMDAVRPGDNGFVPGTHKNVTLIWGGDGNYPGGGVPSGVTVTKDKSIYERARADWFRRHGCDSNGDNCSFLRQEQTKMDAPKPTVPVVQVGFSPAYVGDGNGGSVQWSTFNVKDCKATGFGFNLYEVPYGSWHVKRSYVGKEVYTLTCTGIDGKTYSDTQTAVWFAK